MALDLLGKGGLIITRGSVRTLGGLAYLPVPRGGADTSAPCLQGGVASRLIDCAALLQQVVFLSGPLLVAALITASGPAAALGCSAVLVALAPQVSSLRRQGRPRARRGSRCLPGLAGVLLATLTFGGVMGTFGPVTTAGKRRYVRLSAEFAAALIPLAALSIEPSAEALIAIGTALTAAGLFVTPIAATSYGQTEKATTPAHRTEAFTWLSTSQATGYATERP